MFRFAWLFCLPLLLLNGCFSLTIGTQDGPDRVQMNGLADGFVVVDSIRPYDGRIVELGLFGGKDTWGNLASVEVWPIGGVGLSFVGAKARLAFLEAGVGALGYHPRPSWNSKSTRTGAHDGHDDDDGEDDDDTGD